jgi:hypothetical protein
VITDLLSFIDKTIINEDDVKEFARFYNWENYRDNHYHTKLVKVRNSL